MSESIWSGIKAAWRALDYVPDCPACGGTGEPSPRYRNFVEQVWWRGQLVRVCHNCKGAGKV